MPRIVFYGDSITVGLYQAAKKEAAGSGTELVNKAIGGHGLAANNLASTSGIENGDQVIFSTGWNDMNAANTSVDVANSAYTKSLIARLQDIREKNGGAPILVQGIFQWRPTSSARAQMNAQSLKKFPNGGGYDAFMSDAKTNYINACLKYAAANVPGVVFNERTSEHQTSNDGIHLSASGYRSLFKAQHAKLSGQPSVNVTKSTVDADEEKNETQQVEQKAETKPEGLFEQIKRFFEKLIATLSGKLQAGEKIEEELKTETTSVTPAATKTLEAAIDFSRKKHYTYDASIKSIQAFLNANGFNAGPEDGKPGPLTGDAWKRYEESIQLNVPAGITIDGELSRSEIGVVQAMGKKPEISQSK